MVAGVMPSVVGDVAVPVAAEDELGDLDFPPRQAVAVLVGGHVGADLANADGDVAVPAGQLHEVNDEGFVVLTRQRNHGSHLLGAVPELRQMVEQHDQQLDAAFGAQAVNQARRGRIAVDETLAAEDEDGERS